ncbi:MAG: hypothetical protein J7480_04530 [Microbacteriaceae bacterium]|nr:hypothetical protein [Microbacteriaceae bacterium]
MTTPTATKPKVLFLCVHNAGRSQMALGFFRAHAGDRAIGWSAGSAPADEISDVAVAALAERGIDISAEVPKLRTDELQAGADVVVTLGGGTAPELSGQRIEAWTALPDPAGWTLAGVRPLRDEIERRVLQLLDELDLPERTTP